MHNAPFTKLLQIVVILVFAFSVIRGAATASTDPEENSDASSNEPRTVDDLYSIIYLLVVQKKNYICPLCRKLAPLTEADPPGGMEILAEVRAEYEESEYQNLFFELIQRSMEYDERRIPVDEQKEICTGILRDEIEAFLRHYLNNIRNGESPFREGIDIEIAEEAFVRFLYEYDNGLHNFSCNDEAG